MELSAQSLRAAANYTGQGLERPKRPLWSSHVTVTLREGTATFDGRGYGHGVGLCQYGAQTLAASGRDYNEILSWYYPQVELEHGYR